MGIYDRDYYRNPQPRGGFGAFRMWSITTWLILLNVAVFLLDQVLPPVSILWPGGFVSRMHYIEAYGHFSVGLAIGQWQVWRFLSFQFLHANFSHLFGNMISLYLFGPIVEQYFGRRKFLVFYLLCGIAGGASFLGLWWSHLLVNSTYAPLVGASAGIFGLLVAAAFLAPDVEVFVYFAVVPLRTLAWIMLGVAAFTVFTQGRNAGGEAAHLGGAILGIILIKNPFLLGIFKRRPRMRIAKDWSQDFDR